MAHRMWFSFLLLLATAGTFYSQKPPAQRLSEPEKNFEQLWQTFDRNYALFGAKRIDWDALFRVYRPRVTPQTTDDQLFDIMTGLLGHLNDNHVRLISQSRGYQSGILGQMKMEDFSLTLIKEKYLRNRFQTRVNGMFNFGWLAEGIGYFHFRNFGRLEETQSAIDEIIRAFKDARAVVIDVRSNGGGDDRAGKLIADRFADRKRLYMTTQIRNGPRHEDFTAPKYWYVEPGGPAQFTRPVVLLTHRFSVSAAENFTLAMRVLPRVTIIGDATSGVFADVYSDRLPNGWEFTVPFKLFKDPQEFCWEGIGVPADIRQINLRQDVEQQRDRVVELAIAFLTSGNPKLRSERSGPVDIRESLAQKLARWIDGKGLESAMGEFEKAFGANRDAWYIDEEEMGELGEALWGEGRKSEALEVFRLGAIQFPKSFWPQQRLGDALNESGKTEEAQACYSRAMELNRRSYPWEVTSYMDAKRSLSGVKILDRQLAQDIETKGLEAALQAFEQAKLQGPGTFYIDESRIDQLGYRLLRSGKRREAIEVFKLNVREFPSSFNAYDSLGEAYMQAGQKESAIRNYRKSVELNPENKNSAAILRVLGEPAAPAVKQ